jgi:hypothetical protein
MIEILFSFLGGFFAGITVTLLAMEYTYQRYDK